jgi:hypothetical protein
MQILCLQDIFARQSPGKLPTFAPNLENKPAPLTETKPSPPRQLQRPEQLTDQWKSSFSSLTLTGINRPGQFSSVAEAALSPVVPTSSDSNTTATSLYSSQEVAKPNSEPTATNAAVKVKKKTLAQYSAERQGAGRKVEATPSAAADGVPSQSEAAPAKEELSSFRTPTPPGDEFENNVQPELENKIEVPY